MEENFYKMLIVDDEPLILEGLCNFLKWEDFNIRICAQAESGNEAIKCARLLHPDIIITDIRMPDITGLELIRRLKNVLPNTFFIILSGYDEFDYAKEAISLGAFYYILKPLRKKELIKVIEDCIDALDKIKEEQKEELIISQKAEEHSELINEKTLLNIIKNGSKLELQKNSLNELGIHASNYYSGIVIKYEEDILQRDYRADTIKNILKDKKYEYKDKIEKITFCFLYSMIYILIAFSKDDPGNINYNLKELIDDLVKKIDFQIKIGIGTLVDNPQDITYSFEQANEVLYYRWVQKDIDVFWAEQYKNYDKSLLFISRDAKSRLIYYIETNNHEKIYKLMMETKNQLQKNRCLEPCEIYSTFCDIINTSVKYLYEKEVCLKDAYSTNLFSMEFIGKFKNLDEIFIWLTDFIINLSENYKETKDKQPKKIFKEIEKYVIQNIDKDISLTRLAEEFYYNPSYLSRLFKQELNKNYSVFTSEIRINYSKQLLLNQDMKIGDIAEKVGYKSYKQFKENFKKVTGMTPTEFKKVGRYNADVL